MSLILAFALAIMLGSMTDPWTWGPGLLALVLAVACALPALWKEPSGKPLLLLWGAVCAAWFAWRAWSSPVAELAAADLLLMAACGSSFLVALTVQQHPVAERVLDWGIAALLLASLVVVAIQIADPTYRPLFLNSEHQKWVTGFFTHYNEGANFLVVCSLWLLAKAWGGDNGRGGRLIFSLLGAAGLAAVWFTHSRGGILAAVVGAGVLTGLLLIQAKREKARWFPLAAILMPLLGVALAACLLYGWQEAQEARSGAGQINRVMDNECRLMYLGAAASSIASHPWTGGGSQSFSWESLDALDLGADGSWQTKPEFVHNEWVQAATDYGLIGFGLLLVFIAAVAITAILDLLFAPRHARSVSGTNRSRVAGLAILAGLLTHCCFTFLFHQLPGVLCLGLGLAACMPRGVIPLDSWRPWLARVLTLCASLLAISLMLPLGWKGAQIYQALWSTRYAKDSKADSTARIAALDRALVIQASAALHLSRGLLHHEAAVAENFAGSHAQAAIDDYAAAARLHPLLIEAPLNQAQILSQLQRNAEAEAAYEQAIRLQGSFEPAFRAHYHFALHLHSLGISQLAASDHQAALETLKRAAEQIASTPIRDAQQSALLISILESLGIAHELNGHFAEALATYEQAATNKAGSAPRIHFRSALLLANEANRIWYERRPEEALGLFLQARKCANDAGGQLPFGIDQEQANAFVKQLDDTIALLRSAQIEPKEP